MFRHTSRMMMTLVLLVAVLLSSALIAIPPRAQAEHPSQDTGPYELAQTLGRGLVRSLAWSPDSDILAVGGALGIWLYTPQFADIGLLTGHTKAVYDLAFSPDGAYLASASHDMHVKVWDVEAQSEVMTLEGHTNLVVAVDWHPSQPIIASGSYDNHVRLWDAQTGETLHVFEQPGNWVADVAFNSDGSLLAAASYDGNVWVWDTATYEVVHTFSGHEGNVTAVAWTPGGDLISAGFDGAIRAWDVGNPEIDGPIWTLEAHDDVVYDLAWNPTGFTFASAGWDGRVISWDTLTLSQGAVYADNGGRVHHVGWSPDGQYLATLGWDDTVRIYAEGESSPRVMQEHMDFVVSVGWSIEAITALTLDGRRLSWDPETGSLMGAESVTVEGVPPMSEAAPQGAASYEMDFEGVIRILDADANVIAELPGLHNAAAWSPDGEALLVAVRNGTLRIWHNTDSGAE